MLKALRPASHAIDITSHADSKYHIVVEASPDILHSYYDLPQVCGLPHELCEMITAFLPTQLLIVRSTEDIVTVQIGKHIIGSIELSICCAMIFRTRLFLSCEDEAFFEYNMFNLTRVRSVSTPHVVTCMSSNRDVITVGLHSGEIMIFDAYYQHRPLVGIPHNDSIIALDVGNNHFISGCLGGTVNIWCLQTYNRLFTITHDNPVVSVAISSDGYTFAYGDENGNVFVVFNMGATLHIENNNLPTYNLKFHPLDAKCLATDHYYNGVCLWDFKEPIYALTTLDISNADENGVDNVQPHTVRKVGDLEFVQNVSFSLDGRRLLTTSTESIMSWHII